MNHYRVAYEKTVVKESVVFVCGIETQEVFKSTREAERQLKVDHSDIIKCCKGNKITAGGYHWRYEEVSA